MDRKILVVHKDQRFADYLMQSLINEGYCARSSDSMVSAVAAIHKDVPDLMILSCQLPDINGIKFVTQIKSARITQNVRVITITSSCKENVESLSAGADDYVQQPFTFESLLERVHTVETRFWGTAQLSQDIIRAGCISIDELDKHVEIAGQTIHLTNKEYKILLVLMAGKGRVLTRQELVSQAFGGEKAAVPRLVDVHIASLRSKLGDERGAVETVFGIGYRIAEALFQEVKP